MRTLFALIATLLLATCSQPPGMLERILSTGELRVVTRNSPDAYYLGNQGPEGPSYELASRFAERLGVQLRLYTAPTREAAIEEVAAGRAHVAAAGLTTGISLPPGLDFAPGYHRVQEHLIYRRRGRKPASMRSASRGRIEVAAGSAHQRILQELRLKDPDLVWIERSNTDTEEILAEVSRGTTQFTLASSTEFALNRSVHPELSIALDLAPEASIAWVVNTAGGDKSLLNRVNAFFVNSRTEGVISALLDRYYGEDERFNYLLSRNFMKHLDNRLPRYIDFFQDAAARYDLDWRLLAAMSYQESKWNPKAVSYAGARGLMQLTDGTAKMMRVGNPHDPADSIVGGARYLARVIKKIPSRVPEPDRTWMAVAAYNVGFGHLEDARVLAQGAGRNPDSWEEVSRYLPLLSQERWYTRTKHGYARGWEPVRYVEHVQSYLNILEMLGARPAAAPAQPDPDRTT
jgi:membrane-bound lytic murein transglycosylase F